MYEKIPTGEMTRMEWLRLRKTGLGGSDAGAVCGLHPYRSAMNVFRDKTGDEVEEPDSESIRIGHDLEQYVAERFTEAAGLKVRRANFMYRSTEHPFMIADVDRLVIGEDAGLECKTASAYHADKWADGDIPLHYVMQCYHYMAVTGKRVWYIAALILGRGFVYRRLEWDEDIIGRLIATESDFWDTYVLTGQIPPPDGSRACDEVIARYFGSAKSGMAMALSGFDGKLERRREILQEMARLETEKKQIEQEVKLAMGEHELAMSENYRVSWCNVDSTRLDTRRIKEERPEIYAGYATVSHCRRFEVKAA